MVPVCLVLAAFLMCNEAEAAPVFNVPVDASFSPLLTWSGSVNHRICLLLLTDHCASL